MDTTKEVLESMYAKLDHFLKTETVIGETIDLGEVKLIPIITASFGLGGGVGEEANKAAGGGGLGCRIAPDAILVVRGTEVQMLPVRNKSSLDKIIEQIPGLIDKIDTGKAKEMMKKKKEAVKEKLEKNEDEKKEAEKKKD
jgi:uncharacterized spore protein YtfJ